MAGSKNDQDVTTSTVAAVVPTSIQRTRRLLTGSASRVVAQCFTILRGVISVPILLHYLGQDRYGLWLTVASVFTFLLFADFGLGGGLTTLLSQAACRKDRPAERCLVSTVFFVLIALAAMFVVVDLTVLRTLPWDRYFNVEYAGAARDATIVSTCLIGIFAISIPLTLSTRVYIAYQEAYWSAALNAAGTVLGLIGLLVAVQLKVGLGWLIVAVFGIPQLVNLIALVFLFARHKPWLRPSLRLFQMPQLKVVLGFGFAFAVLELLKVAYNHSDNVIISARLGVGEVVPYAVPFRMFLIATTAFQAAVLPMWGSIGDAKGSNDWDWIRRAFRKLVLYTVFGFGACCVLLAILAPWIVTVWTGGKVTVGYTFVFLLAALAVSNALSNSMQVFLHGLGCVKQQIPFAVAGVAIKLGLAWFLVPRVGIVGPAIASIVAINLTNVPGFAYIVRKELRGRRSA